MTEEQVEALFRERANLNAQIVKLRTRISEIEEDVGLKDIEWIGHYEGTNMEEYRCKKCKEVFVSSVKGICPNCRPFAPVVRGMR